MHFLTALQGSQEEGLHSLTVLRAPLQATALRLTVKKRVNETLSGPPRRGGSGPPDLQRVELLHDRRISEAPLERGHLDQDRDQKHQHRNMKRSSCSARQQFACIPKATHLRLQPLHVPLRGGLVRHTACPISTG